MESKKITPVDGIASKLKQILTNNVGNTILREKIEEYIAVKELKGKIAREILETYDEYLKSLEEDLKAIENELDDVNTLDINK